MRYPVTLKHLIRLAAGMAALVLALGCAKEKNPIEIVNRRPEVRLTAAPIDTSGLYFYSYTVNWVGFDPDGRVDHYLFTIDPHLLAPGQDTVWERTEENERRLFFKSSERIEESSGRFIGRDHHVFVIKAVDDRGESGPYSARAFWSYTIAPEVRISNPLPGATPAFVTPSVRISWSGEDPDGVFTTKPVKYKYKLLSASSEFPKDLAIQRPDSLRRYYVNHPDGPWATWDSTSAETTTVQFTNLTPGADYVFAVIGFDEAGAYSPLFDFTLNLIRLNVGFAAAYGPRITMFNEFFNYSYAAGGYCNCEKAQVKIEVPGRQLVNVNWFAEPPPGSDIKSYRWTLDIEDVFDNTPRQSEQDLAHWSSPSASVTSATIGPFRGGETHFFYIEAEDNNGLKSLGILRLTIVEATFERPLLIVDDTRFRADIKGARDTCVFFPTGPWPTAAELDTFLYARGGARWRCYPEGSPLTPPGIFAGYDFDTLGTRLGKVDMTIPLSTLGKYRHVIWMTDGPSALSNRQGTDPNNPMAAIRFMGLPGRVNTLAAYVKQGGKVWLNGGGAGAAVSDGFNDITNDRPPVSQTKTFSAVSSTRNELGPGRFMYDIAKWQSEFRILRPVVNITKSVGRFTDTPTYAGLPPTLEAKSSATDPLSVEAPTRTSSNLYQTGHDIEFLQLENYITQDLDPDPDVENIQSTLDTLYRVRASTLRDDQPDPARAPLYVIMTYHHGPPPANNTFIHSGFGIWFFRRPHAQAIVDYVLNDIWNVTKNPVPHVAGTHRAPAAAVSAPALSRVPQRRAAPLGAVKSPTPRYPRD